ncbi:hypothetical protein CRU96_14575 [Malaciobacter halophilus]|nr:hypothetical protein [Malaciobacter halophilus]RYA22160.1 hypothetical protein CRU96_14575 [Malaciobacter halophilus]
MNEIFSMVRVQPLNNKTKVLKVLKHNMRKTKEQSIKNNNGIIAFNNDGNEVNLKMVGSDYSKNQYKNYENGFYEKVVEHHKSKNKDYRKTRSVTFNEGILGFSEGINEDYFNNPNEFHERLKKFMNNLSKEFGCKVFNYQIHLDEIETLEDGKEQGNIHVHFLFGNYNTKNGKSIKIHRNKENGGKLQDLVAKHFKSFGRGFKRGIKKDKPRRYLTVQEYKEYQESLKLNNQLKKENEKLTKNNKELEEQIKSMNIKLEEFTAIKKDYEDILINIHSQLKELIEINPETSKDLVEKLWKWFDRSYRSNEKEKKTLEQIQKKIITTYKRINKPNNNKPNNNRP